MVEAPAVMTPAEVARVLGLETNDPARTLRRFVNQGLLRSCRVGREVRYTREAVIAYLDRVGGRDAG